MCIEREVLIRQDILVMKKQLQTLYNQDQDIQKEKIQRLSQEIDKLVNILLREAVSSKKTGDQRGYG